MGVDQVLCAYDLCYAHIYAMPATIETRQRRQQAILTILQRQPVQRQAELVNLLQNEGIDATQSSVSRDLQHLGISKLGQAYHPQSGNDTGPRTDRDQLAGFIRDIQSAGPNLTVIKTAVGAAQRVAVFLDRSEWPEIVGTLSGDDAIFIATRNGQAQRRLRTRLRSSFSE
jgi:transcriptional regulator of arginine metabolism